MKFSRRRLLLIAVATVVLLLTLGTAWNVSASWDLEAAIRELREAGLPTAPRELYPPPLSAERNGAPIYEAAFALIKEIPDPRKDEKDGKDGKNGKDVWWDELPKVSADVRAALPAFGEALELAHRAGELPGCQFTLRYEDGVRMLILHLAPMRRLGLLLVARAAVRQEGGDLAGAQEDLRAAFSLSRALGGEPIMVSQVVRFHVAEKALAVLELVLAASPSKEAILERVQPDDCRGGVAHGLRGEATLGLSLLGIDFLEAIPPGEMPAILRVPLLKVPALKSSVARMARFHCETRLALARPYPEAIAAMEKLEERGRAQGNSLDRLILASFLKAIRLEAEAAGAAARIRGAG